ncbi:hypothetical protein [Vibrio aestuarianus]|jgi:hypothetical protein|uniref:hypothetical protein n=1 Tax=Vibrio aestuarianus TaxID=28171 RepID=UPI0021C31CF3|nr:hypothetical protein [Vibrio aestuarianus]EHI9279485.1 hypothetical protein [Vibrio vulnificus]EJE8540670.1 hypothetical protein [Vibrio vulnificus]EKA7343496.1 hypothetical protein [Vibrio vulnificus]EKD9327785.1 hypothetical protein [Vibrio vulnificus]ELQ2342410.1 hypothetical protein [Vibrio vulnificus]
MEEMISAVLRALGSLIKIVVQLTLIEVIGYSVGWVVSKVVTFGRFPSSEATKSERAKVSYIGLASIVLILLGIAIFNSL